jgi:type II secretory pathway pseudopilin PulG
LVELPVVIAIIGVLIALLLPTVQAAQEIVRRSPSSNSFKQAEIAVQNFFQNTTDGKYDLFTSKRNGKIYYATPENVREIKKISREVKSKKRFLMTVNRFLISFSPEKKIVSPEMNPISGEES